MNYAVMKELAPDKTKNSNRNKRHIRGASSDRRSFF